MKYISVYANKTGKRITSFVVGVHGNNIEEVNEVAEKQYPNEYLVKQNETAWQYALEHELIYNGKEVNLKSIMGVMSLGVPTKAEVEITAEGEDEKDAIASIEKVVLEQKVAE